MATKKVVITGGAGFVGSHVVELFCNKGFEVFVVDDLSFGYKKFVDPRAHFFKGKIQDAKLMDKVLPGAQAVIHLAASSIIRFSLDNPLEHFENNVMGGIRLLKSMRKNGIKKIIFSSSASVYGESKKVSISEDDVKHPKTPYGASKLAFEHFLEASYWSFGVESVSLRCFCGYGPGDEQAHATRAIPVWIKAILTGRSVPLHWKGEQVRDYVYIQDVAEAYLKALKLSGLHFINIGSGRGIVMSKLLRLIEKLTKREAIVEDKGQRSGDPNILVADISKAKILTGWQPKIELEDGLERTIKYYLGRFNL